LVIVRETTHANTIIIMVGSKYMQSLTNIFVWTLTYLIIIQHIIV